MNNKTSLSTKTLKEIQHIDSADILVGVPSFNNESTIGHVMKAVRVGLTKYFPERKSVVVNSDCGSTDKTRAIVKKSLEETDVFRSILISHEKHPFIQNLHVPIQEVMTTFTGNPGKGKAFRRIFDIADRLNAKAVVVVDADLRSITPDWIQLLAGPILSKGYDFVAPLYSRHKFDGFITNTLVYPLTRALYGQKIRQPIGGEFGFSRNVLRHYIRQDIWETAVAYFGVDIWMTTIALTNGFKICQSFLGAKIHNPRSTSSLIPMFRQVMGTLFTLVEEYNETWQNIQKTADLATFGFQAKVIPEEIHISLDHPFRNFHLGLARFYKSWQKILNGKTRLDIEKVAEQSREKFHFPIALWVRAVYDYLLFYHKLHLGLANMNRPLFFESLVPIYFGFLTSFIHTIREETGEDSEEEIEKICLYFEKFKPALIRNWRKIQPKAETSRRESTAHI